MSFAFRRMTTANAQAIVRWRYASPFDYYNPDPSHAEENIQRFLISDNPYYSIHDDTGELVGFCCFGSEGQVPGGVYADSALDIGLGLRPDLTGSGKGSDFLAAILDFAAETFSVGAFRVAVAEFNSRAIRLYGKSGFREVNRFRSKADGRSFIQLVMAK